MQTLNQNVVSKKLAPYLGGEGLKDAASYSRSSVEAGYMKSLRQ